MHTSNELKHLFLEFFKTKEHEILPSSSLVPEHDPTLLFTNAGMVQFKDVFLGYVNPPNKRVVTSQRCIRVGGKHNDLENVGYTTRHHTFFEMLGNFSFGDYFKAEAINYAWEYLRDVLQLPEERLWITVHQKDDETARIWQKEIGVREKKIIRLGDKENFWSMGETGPCGPSSEIYYDYGEDMAGGPPGSANSEGDRYIEIWNLVFTQYARDADGTLTPIPKPSVDTGMGLERIAAIMQGVTSNYQTDLFHTLISAIIRMFSLPKEAAYTHSIQVIADHIRACAFLIADGVLPSNERRGYVLRRIIRRAARHGHQLKLPSCFLYQLVKPLIDTMGEDYLELGRNGKMMTQILLQEEERFGTTLEQGLRLLEKILSQQKDPILPGEVIFKLYDTYGFPADLTADIAKEHGISVDMAGFQVAMDTQRNRARATGEFDAATEKLPIKDLQTTFIGYDILTTKQAKVTAIYDAKGNPCDTLGIDQKGGVVLDKTVFYAESGGQVGDCGKLKIGNTLFQVTDTQQHENAYIHFGYLQTGHLQVGDMLATYVHEKTRQQIACHHSATHLLHAALRTILGEHVFQKGSLVSSEKLRFDFSHHKAITNEQLQQIEQLVNEKILANTEVYCTRMSLTKAKASGALSLFSEQYDDMVRVLDIGEGFSRELCGGTHVKRTGDIGLFKIASETGIAASIRRIEAVTAQAALNWSNKQSTTLKKMMQQLHADEKDVLDKLQQQAQRLNKQETIIKQLNQSLVQYTAADLAKRVNKIGDILVLACQVEHLESKALRILADKLKSMFQQRPLVLALAIVQDRKINILTMVKKTPKYPLNANELMQFIAGQINGQGGGNNDFAQGGGTDVAALPKTLEAVLSWVQKTYQEKINF